ncbi:MAG: hypothetical protein SV966_07455 [Actinomycetota bacterium]|nr:hypothetical protein [Actinomycetota bacterium]
MTDEGEFDRLAQQWYIWTQVARMARASAQRNDAAAEIPISTRPIARIASGRMASGGLSMSRTTVGRTSHFVELVTSDGTAIVPREVHRPQSRAGDVAGRNSTGRCVKGCEVIMNLAELSKALDLIDIPARTIAFGGHADNSRS